MDVLVLVKYVADIDHIPADAWDFETGTLRRGRLQMVANPLDDRALFAGRSVARATGGRLRVLSMGPPSAERICRRAISFGADDARLLSDAAFAGSDTLATARVLTRAIERYAGEPDLRNTLIFAGMQSPDGDTAQVPAEVASLLGVPFLPYLTSCGLRDGELVTESIGRCGRLHHVIHGPPVVATWTALAEPAPFHTSLDGFRRASEACIEPVTASALGLDPDQVGLPGSATRVIKIVTVPRGRADGHLVTLADAPDPDAEIAALLEWMHDRLPSATSSRERHPERAADQPVNAGETPAETAPGTPLPRERTPDVWVCIERDGDDVEPGSLELLGKARELADDRTTDATAFLFDRRPSDDLIRLLTRHGATRIVCAASRPPAAADRGEDVKHHRDAHSLAAAVRRCRPRTVLIPATLAGRTVSALAAAALGAGLTADCTGLELDPADGRLLQTRPALGGNVLATIVSQTADAVPEMATVRSGVFPPRSYPVAAISVETVTVPGPAAFAGGGSVGLLDGMDRAAETSRTRSAADAVTGVNPDADMIVAVGLGIGSEESVNQWVVPLVRALEERFGLRVSMACSRAAVDAGILPYPYQIGQTGKSVRPSVYLALGISGAIQHRLGMERSAAIVSVNPDPQAPIHAISDYALVGTTQEVLPALLRMVDAVAPG